MNLEVINKWLDNEYGCSYTRLEELHDWLVDRDIKNKDEITRLNNIINELEKWIKENDLGKYRIENVVNTDELLDYLKELKEEGNE